MLEFNQNVFILPFPFQAVFSQMSNDVQPGFECQVVKQKPLNKPTFNQAPTCPELVFLPCCPNALPKSFNVATKN